MISLIWLVVAYFLVDYSGVLDGMSLLQQAALALAVLIVIGLVSD